MRRGCRRQLLRVGQHVDETACVGLDDGRYFSVTMCRTGGMAMAAGNHQCDDGDHQNQRVGGNHAGQCVASGEDADQQQQNDGGAALHRPYGAHDGSGRGIAVAALAQELQVDKGRADAAGMETAVKPEAIWEQYKPIGLRLSTSMKQPRVMADPNQASSPNSTHTRAMAMLASLTALIISAG